MFLIYVPDQPQLPCSAEGADSSTITGGPLCWVVGQAKPQLFSDLFSISLTKNIHTHQLTQIRKRQICLTLGFIWSKIRGNSAATFIKQKNHKIDWILRFWGICLCKWRFTQNSLHKKTVWHSKFLEKMNLHKETPKDGKIQSILRLFCFTKLTAKFPV